VILVLLFLLASWVGVIITASGSRQEEPSGAGPAETDSPAGPVERLSDAHRLRHAGWELVWRDEFDQANCPSRAKWSFEHGFVRNGELQWYQPQNAFCRDGVLVLEARRERKSNPDYDPRSTHWRRNRRVAEYTSASIASRYSFTYGRAEALIRIDPRPGSWPAFWTVGAAFRRDPGAWPATGEVDIMEYYRNTVLANVCNPKPSWCGWSSTRQSLADLGGQAWADRFHLWAMEWNARHIDLYLDGRRVHRFAVADAVHNRHGNPYVNRRALLLLSQALGGVHGGHPTNAEVPARLEVGYVRVYQSAGDVRRGALN
jgi:beta-glucanase (GH16 family)